MSRFTLAGDEGFEPPIVEPESTALPLGQSPLTAILPRGIILKIPCYG
jgi:hypothetical protein